MKSAGRKLLGNAICDIIRPIGELAIAGQRIVEQPSIVRSLTE
jgi:hypothetical protein